MSLSEKSTRSAAKESSNKWVTRIIEAVILVLALALGLTIRLAVYETAIVISGSMEPALMINDRVLVDHRNTLSGKWRRGDVLLFDPPESWGGDENLTKRLIGLPGETVQMERFRITIDGHELVEPYIRHKNGDEAMIIQLGPGQYWVMGDNRDNSQDSRDLGPINEENIRGRGIYRIFPFNRAGRLSLPKYGF